MGQWAPGTRVGSYVVEARLGEGGMGVVYQATHAATGAVHALKALPRLASEEDEVRFRREAEALARLNHPHVVRVHDLFEHQREHVLVLELCAGGDLRARVRQGKVDPDAARRAILEVARGLAAAHAQGVLHRDLKPENVFFDEEGRAKLGDFGLAKVADRQSLTATGALLGTPAYMAPEQIEGHVDERSDVYGLGGVFYFALTGVAPFQGTSVFDVLSQVANAPPVRPRVRNPQVSAALEEICLKALQKGRARRQQSVAEFVADLEAGALEGQGRGATSAGLLVVAALVFVALLGLGASAFGSREGERQASPTPRPTRDARGARQPRPVPTPTPEVSTLGAEVEWPERWDSPSRLTAEKRAAALARLAQREPLFAWFQRRSLGLRYLGQTAESLYRSAIAPGDWRGLDAWIRLYVAAKRGSLQAWHRLGEELAAEQPGLAHGPALGEVMGLQGIAWGDPTTGARMAAYYWRIGEDALAEASVAIDRARAERDSTLRDYRRAARLIVESVLGSRAKSLLERSEWPAPEEAWGRLQARGRVVAKRPRAALPKVQADRDFLARVLSARISTSPQALLAWAEASAPGHLEAGASATKLLEAARGDLIPRPRAAHANLLTAFYRFGELRALVYLAALYRDGSGPQPAREFSVPVDPELARVLLIALSSCKDAATRRVALEACKELPDARALNRALQENDETAKAEAFEAALAALAPLDPVFASPASVEEVRERVARLKERGWDVADRTWLRSLLRRDPTLQFVARSMVERRGVTPNEDHKRLTQGLIEEKNGRSLELVANGLASLSGDGGVRSDPPYGVVAPWSSARLVLGLIMSGYVRGALSTSSLRYPAEWPGPQVNLGGLEFLNAPSKAFPLPTDRELQSVFRCALAPEAYAHAIRLAPQPARGEPLQEAVHRAMRELCLRWPALAEVYGEALGWAKTPKLLVERARLKGLGKDPGLSERARTLVRAFHDLRAINDLALKLNPESGEVVGLRLALLHGVFVATGDRSMLEHLALAYALQGRALDAPRLKELMARLRTERSEADERSDWQLYWAEYERVRREVGLPHTLGFRGD